MAPRAKKKSAATPKRSPAKRSARGASAASASANQRLRASNGALRRANAALRDRCATLATAHTDLDNLLATNNVAILRLDRAQHIKWFSTSARELLGVDANAIGRPLSAYPTAVSGKGLAADVRKALRTGSTIEVNVKSADGRWYLRRTRPSRLAEGGVDGVIVAYPEVTEWQRKAEQALAASAAQARSLEHNVEERTRQLRHLMFRLAMAEERERRAIASELHDHPAQLLAVANVRLSGLLADAEPGEPTAALREVAKLVQEAERALRSLMFQISPPVLFELGLVPALDWLAEEMQRVYGLVTRVRDHGVPTALDQAIRSTVFRAVRELLINVARHAKVGQADVDVRLDGKTLVASVSDAGVGFDRAALERSGAIGGFGLQSVRERVRSVGGTFEIDSRPGDGTVATLGVPMDLRAPEAGAASA